LFIYRVRLIGALEIPYSSLYGSAIDISRVYKRILLLVLNLNVSKAILITIA